MADFLAKEADALKSDPAFAAEVRSAADRLSIPLPAAVVSDRTCSAVARRCSDLIAAGDLRQAAALLAGHRLAIVQWTRWSMAGDRRCVQHRRMDSTVTHHSIERENGRH